MRMMAWSADVSSSDLAVLLRFQGSAVEERRQRLAQGAEGLAQARLALALAAVGPDPLDDRVTGRALVAGQGQHRQHQRGLAGRKRSEEHTSELQSLMRNSYAVFCLKKKKKQKQE